MPASMPLQRERGSRNPSDDAVERLDPEGAVGGLVLLEGDDQRARLEREGQPILGGELDEGVKLLERDLARLVEATAEDRLGRLVVIEEVPGRVEEQDRHGEVARQLSHQDELDGFLGHMSLRAQATTPRSRRRRMAAAPLSAGRRT